MPFHLLVLLLKLQRRSTVKFKYKIFNLDHPQFINKNNEVIVRLNTNKGISAQDIVLAHVIVSYLNLDI